MTERIVAVGGAATSFVVGSKMLKLLMDLKVSARTVNATTVTIEANSSNNATSKRMRIVIARSRKSRLRRSHRFR